MERRLYYSYVLSVLGGYMVWEVNNDNINNIHDPVCSKWAMKIGVKRIHGDSTIK